MEQERKKARPALKGAKMRIIDSDIFIDAFRGVKKAEKWMKNAIQDGDCAFSAITESELLSGKDCNDVNKRESLLHFLALFSKISVDNPITQIAGDFRRKYGISLPDAIIAASATHTKSLLITRNVKDFSKIENLKIESY